VDTKLFFKSRRFDHISAFHALDRVIFVRGLLILDASGLIVDRLCRLVDTLVI
jgi:hypothetical protein